MFIVTLVIMLPTYLATKDPVAAWMAGLAWAFIIGCIILIGAFVGPTIRRFTPRAAMLGTLMGISLAFISMRPARADVGRAVDRPAGVHDHHRRLRRGRPAAGQLPGRPGGAARRLRDRLDRRLHGARRGRRRGRGDRGRHPVAEHRPAARRARGHLAAARHRDPIGHLQLHRGDEQRGERRGRGRLTTTSATSCSPTAPAPWSAPRSARRSRPPSTSATRAGRRPAAGSPTRWRPASRSSCSACSALFPLLGGAAADPRDRPGAAVHRPRDRLAGLRRGAEGALRGGRAGRDPVPRGLGLGHGPRRAAGRRHERREGRRGGAGQRRRALRGAAEARRGLGAGRHGARHDRGVRDRPALHRTRRRPARSAAC